MSDWFDNAAQAWAVGLALAAITLQVGGLLASFHALLYGRTAQGTVAWVVALVLLPYFALPFYLVFGQHRFSAYVHARRRGSREIDREAKEALEHTKKHRAAEGALPGWTRVLQDLAYCPPTQGNRVRLHPGGHAAFEAMFAAIDRAEHYVLVQFYIVRDDELGREMLDHLVGAARRGVRVYFLYDAVGSLHLGRHYVRELTQAGIAVASFGPSGPLVNPLRLNFRNHRKLVLADGALAYIGGLNLGNEYAGWTEKYGDWRDTQISLHGPAAAAIQTAFIEDWHWASGEALDLDCHRAVPQEGGLPVLILPTGPDNERELCQYFFLQAFQSARKRLWVVSPYFVPDEALEKSLKLAAMRGVDVRVILPESYDKLLPYLSSFSFLEDAADCGVKFFRYRKGFLHQKILLVDDEVAAVNTANLDNRSIRINFELNALIADHGFARQVEEMLEEDLRHCREVGPEEYHERSFAFRLAVRAARLLAPIQ